MRMDTRWSTCLALSVLVTISVSRLAICSVVAHIKTNIPFSFKATCPDSPVQNPRGLTVDLSCFDTGIKARNEHMLEDLNVKEHPVAWMNLVGNNGTLYLNGHSKPVTVAVVDSKRVFSFKLSDFGIPARSHLGLKIQDEISVEVSP